MRPPVAYHFSVDDVLGALLEVSDARMPLFEHPFFAFLRQLHDEFDVTVDLYLFYRTLVAGRSRTLAEISASVNESLDANPWLRLGPHALDRDTPPHAQSRADQQRTVGAIYAEIDRFAPAAHRSRWVRLHEFSECYEIARYLRSHGVDALLTTDKPAVSYRLPTRCRERLARRGRTVHRGIGLIRSDLRVEQLVAAGLSAVGVRRALDDLLRRRRRVVVFTHEYELARPAVREMTRIVLQHLASRAVSV